MSGTFAHLTFSNRAGSCVEIVDRLRSFAYKRMTFRTIMRLEGNQPVFGRTPQEWQEVGVSPGDLGLEDGEWWMDVVESSRRDALTIEQALTQWAIGPWVGLCVAYDLPPGRDGFPDMYGACRWRIWACSAGSWQHSASIEYPDSSVRNDARWGHWLVEFMSGAEKSFDAECKAESPIRLPPPGRKAWPVARKVR